MRKCPCSAVRGDFLYDSAKSVVICANMIPAAFIEHIFYTNDVKFGIKEKRQTGGKIIKVHKYYAIRE